MCSLFRAAVRRDIIDTHWRLIVCIVFLLLPAGLSRAFGYWLEFPQVLGTERLRGREIEPPPRILDRAGRTPAPAHKRLCEGAWHVTCRAAAGWLVLRKAHLR